MRNILVRLGLKNVYPKFPKYVNTIWVFLIGPLGIVAVIFGGLAGGSSGHVRTIHGVSFCTNRSGPGITCMLTLFPPR